MAKAVASAVALVLLGVSASALPPLTLHDATTLKPNTLTFVKLGDEVCGAGNPMYYGIVTPTNITAKPKRIYIESMGGAVCFNNASCMDKEHSVWLDLLKIVERYVGAQIPYNGQQLPTAQFFQFLTGGLNLDRAMFAALQLAYFPNGPGGPLDGEVGYYFPSCTGDAGLGNYKVTYGSTAIHHTGSAQYMLLLQALRRKTPDLERITLIGASGSAVSRVAWAPTVADMFPKALVQVVADSAMHVLPASTVFDHFWSEVQWSPNPSGKHDQAQLYATNMKSLPTFDWRCSSVISDMLKTYGGRVKLLYIGCIHDDIVVSDRLSLAKYAKLSVPATKEAVEAETWAFLQGLVRDAPTGSVYSFIPEGTCHHMTRKGFQPGAKAFAESFLKGETLAPAHVWSRNVAPPTGTASGSPAQCGTGVTHSVSGQIEFKVASMAQCESLKTSSTFLAKMKDQVVTLVGTGSSLSTTVSLACSNRRLDEGRRLSKATAALTYKVSGLTKASADAGTARMKAQTPAALKTAVTTATTQASVSVTVTDMLQATAATGTKQPESASLAASAVPCLAALALAAAWAQLSAA